MPSSYSEAFVEFLAELGAAESPELEFKEAGGGIPHSLWETVCAFANTSGGTIVLGVRERDDDLEVVGVPNARQRVDDLYSQARSQNKISKDVMSQGGISIRTVDGRDLIVISVRPAERRARPIFLRGQAYGGTYLRRSTGDFAASPDEVNRMMREASDLSADAVILSGYGVEDLDQSAIVAYRRLVLTHDPASPSAEFDDLQFLRHIEAWRRDRHSAEEGVTVAGLLMFGTDAAIRDWRVRHLIDARLMPAGSEVDEPDWADRVVWEGHLFGAYRRLEPWLTRDLPVPFRLEQGRRVEDSPRHIALREALVNLLVHADYKERGASLILRWDGGVRFRNPGNSRIPQPGFHGENHSDPRNPILVRMFRRIGLAEEAGSGIPRIYRAWRELGYEPPEVEPHAEQHEFRITLPYEHLLSAEDRAWLETFDTELTDVEQLALVIARQEGGVDNQAVRAVTGAHGADVSKVLTGLRDRGFLSMVGNKRGARYFLKAPSNVDSGSSLVDSGSAFVDSIPELVDFGAKSVDSGPEFVDFVLSLDAMEASPETQARLQQLAALAMAKAYLSREVMLETIVQLCHVQPLTIREIAELLNRTEHHVGQMVRTLVADSRLRPLEPGRRLNQRYVATDER